MELYYSIPLFASLKRATNTMSFLRNKLGGGDNDLSARIVPEDLAIDEVFQFASCHIVYISLDIEASC